MKTGHTIKKRMKDRAMKRRQVLVTFLAGVAMLAGYYSQADNSLNAGEEGETPCIALTRTVPGGTYTPGEALTVEILAESSCADKITAFGISEDVPDDWVFDSVEEITGSKPIVRFANGVLEFSWINGPPFPLQFRYTILPVASTAEILQFSGNAYYFFDVGNDMRRSETISTTVDPSPGSEGEQEGEVPVPAGCCRVVSTAGKPSNSKTRFVLSLTDFLLFAFTGLGL